MKNFIKKQQQAMLYLAAVFALVMGSQYLPDILYPARPVDFSEFDSQYQQKLSEMHNRKMAPHPDSASGISQAHPQSFFQSPQSQKNSGENAPKSPPDPAIFQQVNINTADATALMKLPRIGPVIAQRIIDHRQANGPFLAAEDIMNVKGIGKATFAKIAPLISVR